MEKEKDLHYKVVEFIRKYYPDALLIAGLGEHQTTTAMRSDAYKKGYTSGQPDLMILDINTNHTGLAIEFKRPNFKYTATENQNKFLDRLKENSYVTLVSNDYDEILKTIVEYFCDEK
jgi:hypothetical protein